MLVAGAAVLLLLGRDAAASIVRPAAPVEPMIAERLGQTPVFLFSSSMEPLKRARVGDTLHFMFRASSCIGQHTQRAGAEKCQPYFVVDTEVEVLSVLEAPDGQFKELRGLTNDWAAPNEFGEWSRSKEAQPFTAVVHKEHGMVLAKIPPTNRAGGYTRQKLVQRMESGAYRVSDMDGFGTHETLWGPIIR